jgi:hypothetical protein
MNALGIRHTASRGCVRIIVAALTCLSPAALRAQTNAPAASPATVTKPAAAPAKPKPPAKPQTAPAPGKKKPVEQPPTKPTIPERPPSPVVLHARGMDIHYGPGGSRTTVRELLDHSMVVSNRDGYGYIQHPYRYGDAEFVHRTYYVNGGRLQPRLPAVCVEWSCHERICV